MDTFHPTALTILLYLSFGQACFFCEPCTNNPFFVKNYLRHGSPQVAVALQIQEAAEELQVVGVDFSGQADVWNVKLFRWLDNKEDSTSYRKNVEQLVPAIMSVLPLRYRDRVVKNDSFAYRMARLEKEVSEAKQALMLDAPKKEKLKELGEGIFEMFRVDPDLTAPLLAMVTTMLGAI